MKDKDNGKEEEDKDKEVLGKEVRFSRYQIIIVMSIHIDVMFIIIYVMLIYAEVMC